MKPLGDFLRPGLKFFPRPFESMIVVTKS